jgi:hypothetical protein
MTVALIAADAVMIAATRRIWKTVEPTTNPAFLAAFFPPSCFITSSNTLFSLV